MIMSDDVSDDDSTDDETDCDGDCVESRKGDSDNAEDATKDNYTSQQDFGTRKVYCGSNVTFHAESKYAIKIFPSPTVFVQWPFKLLIFRYFWYFHQ